MDVPIYQVDAFAEKIFAGNPAAVCPLHEWLDDAVMQAIAAENNLSETAFFVREGDDFKLRWFTPQSEVDLCGHATLASAFVLFNILAAQDSSIRFHTRSGVLTVSRDGGLISMDFPSWPPEECPKPPASLEKALSPDRFIRSAAVLQGKSKYFVIYENEEQILDISPNFQMLKTLHPFSVCVTAPGGESDFVSRYFVPSYGIPEDSVTGSTHSSLVPYWSKRLNKGKLHARQLSKRSGDLWCELKKDRVTLKGKAVLYLTGSISI
ncbi:MAG: PhzF family phenazine biosynthesis protein [Terriglobales bacterium]